LLHRAVVHELLDVLHRRATGAAFLVLQPQDAQ
jgi:hypothetical protein